MAGTQDIQFIIDPDATRASVVIRAGTEPETVTVQALEAAAAAADVSLTDEARGRLKAVVDRYRAAPDLDLNESVMERVEPADGEDGRLEFEDRFAHLHETADAAAAAGADGAPRDYYAGKCYVRVSQGTIIGTLHPPTAGTPGRDARGKEIEPKPGRAREMAFDATVALDGGGRIIAQTDGVLMFDGQSLTVTTLLDVPGDVDFSVGNIDFDGAVAVKGDVRARFVVKASEDITIGGLVEAATIICGGNLACRCGFASRDRGSIEAGGTVAVSYLNNVRGRIGRDLQVRREILSCDLTVGGDVLCGEASFIGGTLCANGRCDLAILGSDAAVPTVVRFGLPPKGDERLQLLDEHIARLRKILEARRPGGRAPGRSAAQAAAGSKPAPDLAGLLEECYKARSRVLRSRVSPNADLRVSRAIHPQVTVQFGDEEHCFDRTLAGPVRMTLDPEVGLRYSIANGPWHPISELRRTPRRVA